MGRPRKHNHHLPAGVYEKHGAFYRVVKGKWIRLGTDAGVTEGGMRALISSALAHKSEHVKRSTLVAYRSAARKLAETFTEFDPQQVTPRDVVEMRNALAKTPNMANACVNLLRIVFDYALEQRLVDFNPCVGVKRFKERKRDRCPSDDELARVHAHAGPQLRVIIELAVLTGRRICDVLKIRRADIVDGGAGIRFVDQKTGKPITIRNAELRATIARADALHGNVRAMTLLHNSRGKAPDYWTVRAQFAAACRAAGVKDLHQHDLRAKAITAAKKQGLDPRAIANHASEAMTARYIREHEEPVVQGPSFRRILDI